MGAKIMSQFCKLIKFRPYVLFQSLVHFFQSFSLLSMIDESQVKYQRSGCVQSCWTSWGRTGSSIGSNRLFSSQSIHALFPNFCSYTIPNWNVKCPTSFSYCILVHHVKFDSQRNKNLMILVFISLSHSPGYSLADSCTPISMNSSHCNRFT